MTDALERLDIPRSGGAPVRGPSPNPASPCHRDLYERHVHRHDVLLALMFMAGSKPPIAEVEQALRVLAVSVPRQRRLEWLGSRSESRAPDAI